MTTRIATLNIRHGGTKHGEALTARLLGYDADLLVVTEFRANEAGTALVAQLDRAGYATTHPVVEPKQNGVLIATHPEPWAATAVSPPWLPAHFEHEAGPTRHSMRQSGRSTASR